MMSPGQILIVSFTIDENTPKIGKIFEGMAFILDYSVASILNLVISQITQSAHRPRKYFYGYLTRNSLSFEHRMKIIAFIEWMCGPDIGFYCMDWFLLNSFEFYKYCAFCVSFYIMVSQYLSE